MSHCSSEKCLSIPKSNALSLAFMTFVRDVASHTSIREDDGVYAPLQACRLIVSRLMEFLRDKGIRSRRNKKKQGPIVYTTMFLKMTLVDDWVGTDTDEAESNSCP